ncbi:MAG: hypothetical protein ACLR8L_08105 [Oscillospiraceae bacterium]
MQNEAWIDEENRIVSFHEIPNSRYYSAEEHEFWQMIVSLIASWVSRAVKRRCLEGSLQVFEPASCISLQSQS